MPKLKITPPDKKLIAFMIKVAIVLIFAVLLVTMLPAAMPESEYPEDIPTATMPFDDEMPEIDATARPDLFPHLVVVYSEGDSWGKEVASHLVSALEPRFHAHFVMLSDVEYLALDEDQLALYNGNPSLTLNLGITRLLNESYLEVLSRLGSQGLEIRRTKDRIDITSASLSRVHEGVKAFLDALSFDSSFTVSDELYLLDAKKEDATDFKPDIVTDGEVKLLVLSYLDSNPYTLRAIGGIIAHTKPDIVVFNGNIDGKAETRAELAAMWQAIADLLKKTETPWCFTPGALSSNLPRVTVCEIISSFEGCIRPISGDADASFSLTVANSNGIVTSSIYVGDTLSGNASLCELIESEARLYARASDYRRSITAILPALPKQIYDSCEELNPSFVSKNLSDLYDSLEASGADSYICASGTTATGSVKFADGTLALCGSVGFDSYGLGGRFDYNHSLRGGVLLTLTPHRAGYSQPELSYVLAAELGLTER
jgi:hypothetical protein